MPVLSVLGNHEFYKSNIEKERAAAQEAAKCTSVTVLDDHAIEINGVRFIGATLWTDYRLHGSAVQSGFAAARGLNDHRLIRTSGGTQRFTPADALKMHQESRAFVERTLANPFSGQTIVITHHCPSSRSVPERFTHDKIAPAYASNLHDVIDRYQPNIWIHGHTHDSFDYMIGDTRVVCNPHGYPQENSSEFRWDLVIELDDYVPKLGVF